MAPSKLSRGLAKALFIDLDYRKNNEPKEAVHSAAESFESIETYEEREPTVAEYLYYHRPTAAGGVRYIKSLFPFWQWIFHYNLYVKPGFVFMGSSNGVQVDLATLTHCKGNGFLVMLLPV